MSRLEAADSQSMNAIQQTVVTDEPQPRESFVVACIRCGARRTTGRTENGRLTSPVCEWCGDPGWSEPGAVASPDVAHFARHHSR
jgi:hypothetical protein